MYVTRPLSQFRKWPSSLSEEPPEGPFSGVLVITDEEAVAEDSFCFGICKRTRIKKLPFPQDKILSVVHTDSSVYRGNSVTKVLFIPVLDQPLSSNRYYVVRAKGKYKGRACLCSREIDKGICCFPSILQDKKPKPLDPRNIYHTIKIHRHHRHTFFAKSIAPDGTPPLFLKKKGWEIKISRSLCPWKLKEALGLDENLRTRLPNFNFTVSKKRSATVLVGEWYCPFVFVKEPYKLRHQMKKSIFYKMTLTQHWEQIYHCENTSVNNENAGNSSGNNVNVVNIDVDVQREANYVLGMEVKKDDKEGHGGFYSYRGIPGSRGQRTDRLRRRTGVALGLSFAVVERMRRVMEEGGWVGGERVVKVERVEEIRVSNGHNSRSSSNSWRRFGCYVLVESFRLKRTDGTLLLKCEFRHTHRVRRKWE